MQIFYQDWPFYVPLLHGSWLSIQRIMHYQHSFWIMPVPSIGNRNKNIVLLCATCDYEDLIRSWCCSMYWWLWSMYQCIIWRIFRIGWQGTSSTSNRYNEVQSTEMWMGYPRDGFFGMLDDTW